MDHIAHAADGGSDVPTTADRHAFSYAARGPDDGGLVAESTPASPKETDHRCAKLKSNVEKSPISIVNEFMLRHGKQIHYHLISTKGTTHCPEFTYCLLYNYIKVYGSGNSKKEAKKNTAIAFLKKLESVNNTETTTTFNNFFSQVNDNYKVKTVDVESKLNYIGILQELCMSRHWELPKYEFCQKKSSDDNWSVICCIQLFKSKGEDKSKQTAKNKSAYFMYEHIKDLSQEEITFFNYHERQIINNYNKSIIDMSTLIKCICPDIRMKMFSNLFKSKKPCINNLKKCNSISEFKMSSVDILKKIGEEEGFNVVFEVDVVNKSKKFEVFVKLSLTPILTHMCSGNAIEETQQTVASDVLSYFKLVLTN